MGRHPADAGCSESCRVESPYRKSRDGKPGGSRHVGLRYRGMPLLEHLHQDLRFAIRSLLKSPGFTVVVVATLALGIGVNTAVFSVVNTVLLKPVQAPDADRIVVFGTAREGQGPSGGAPTRFNAWRQLGDLFEDIAAYRYSAMNLTGIDAPRQVQVGQVSRDYFSLFGIPVARGRSLTTQEDLPNAGGVAVISDALWKQTFSSDSQMLGQAIFLGGDPYVVIGIAAPPVTAESRADVWIPMQIDPASQNQAHYFGVAGRTRLGVTGDVIDARLELASDEFARTYPEIGARLGGSRFVVRSIQEVAAGGRGPTLLLLSGAVGLVLLIACANVANLLLIRASVKKREIAVRAGLGAGRARLVRQLFTESSLLWIVGGTLGLYLGNVGIRALLSLNPTVVPRIGADGSGLAPDWRVFSFAAAATMLTAILFGLIPAVWASRADLSAIMNGSGRGGGSGRGETRSRSALVVAEIAMALTLVIGSGLLIRSFIEMRAVELGYDSGNALVIDVTLTGARYSKTAAVYELFRSSVARLEALPGVESATATCCAPGRGGPNSSYQVAGRPLGDSPAPRATMPSVLPGYFDLMKIPLLRGRDFTASDRAGSPGVVIVSDALARKHWPNGDAIGERLGIGSGSKADALQVVGVVGNVRDRGAADPAPLIYVPVSQQSDNATSYYVRYPQSWIIRTRGAPESVAEPISKELELATGLPAFGLRTIERALDDSTARQDFNMTLMLVFGGSALLLASIGIYGLMAYSVQQRRTEIGVRMAVGANRADVWRSVLAQGLRLTVLGIAVGVTGAFYLAELLSGFIFGVETRDPIVFIAAPLVLAAVALTAVALPALRASRVDPLNALRHD